MRVGILGGGIAGLACAHYLSKSGDVPVVLAESPHLGDAGAPIVHRGVAIERVHEPILQGDTAVCGLLAQLGAAGRLIWRESRSAVLLDGVLYPSGRPVDVMRIDGLRPSARLRAALGLVYATRLKRYGLSLDRTPTSEWLLRLLGEEAFGRLSRPWLESRFGEYANEQPAYAAWHQLNARTGPMRGTLLGDEAWLCQALRQSTEAHGGEIRTGVEVTAVENGGASLCLEIDGVDERFDAVVCTQPPPLLAKIARGHLVHELPPLDLAYQGRVTCLVISRKPPEPYYHTDVIDPALPFHTVVEASRLLPERSRAGLTLTYLTRYCAPHTESFGLPDDVVQKQAMELLGSMGRFREDSVEAVHVTREPLADPLWTRGYLAQKPPQRIGDTRVYLCSSAQTYPRVPSWDTGIVQARQSAGELQRHLG